jgi:DNA-directed RNA polymerase specialized sigma24 family protein
VPGVRWVRLPEDKAALQNQWLLVAEEPEPIAFVGFETSNRERFGGSRSATSEVRGALGRLPAEQGEVLTLASFGDLTQTEIADRLGVPLGTVKARAFRGLRRLADILGTAG